MMDWLSAKRIFCANITLFVLQVRVHCMINDYTAEDEIHIRYIKRYIRHYKYLTLCYARFLLVFTRMFDKKLQFFLHFEYYAFL